MSERKQDAIFILFLTKNYLLLTRHHITQVALHHKLSVANTYSFEEFPLSSISWITNCSSICGSEIIFLESYKKCIQENPSYNFKH